MNAEQEQIEQVLGEVRPMLARHAGDIEFVGFEAGVVKVRFLGMCRGCPLSALTLKAGVEEFLRAKIPGVRAVEAVA